jgi:hypothetical protein
MEEQQEKKCALCGAVFDGVAETDSGEFTCRRCATSARYDGVNLVAINITNYYAMLAELEARNKELVGEIEFEGNKGSHRDMGYLRKKHLERQDVLAECSFLSHFRAFVEKW